MGGWLADPVSTLPGLFGPGGRFECSLVKAYPYALPSITNAVILALVGCIVALALEEVRLPEYSLTIFIRKSLDLPK
jgi:hypothetical protein